MTMQERMFELTDLRYVQQHLQRYGVGPYMLSAADRLNRDIQEVMMVLGCGEDEALEYIKQGIRGIRDDGPEPERGEVDSRE